MNEPLPNLASRAADRLRDLANRVTNRRPTSNHSLHFNLGSLGRPECVEKIVADLNNNAKRGQRIIYQFRANETEAYTELAAAFSRKPTTLFGDKKPNYSRLIDPARPGALYVGSSRDFCSRVRQHLDGKDSLKTYSMHLALWATEVSARIELAYWIYEQSIDPIELEALEQELWDARTPLLGKRSGR